MRPELPCAHEARYGPRPGLRRGPSLGTPSYELAVNGQHQLRTAVLDVLTWADRVQHRATALGAATTSPQEVSS